MIVTEHVIALAQGKRLHRTVTISNEATFRNKKARTSGGRVQNEVVRLRLTGAQDGDLGLCNAMQLSNPNPSEFMSTQFTSAQSKLKHLSAV